MVDVNFENITLCITCTDRLKEVFSKYGKIEKCRLVRDIGEMIVQKFSMILRDY